LLVGRTTYELPQTIRARTWIRSARRSSFDNYWAQATSDALFGDLKVAVGRLPINSVAELNVAVARILTHQPLRIRLARAGRGDVADPAAGDFAAKPTAVIAATPDYRLDTELLGITHAAAADVTPTT